MVASRVAFPGFTGSLSEIFSMYVKVSISGPAGPVNFDMLGVASNRAVVALLDPSYRYLHRLTNLGVLDAEVLRCPLNDAAVKPSKLIPSGIPAN